MNFTPESAFEVNDPTVISETIDGETIIINLVSGTYYSLKHSGATIWSGVQQSASVAQIAAMAQSRFETAGEDIEGEISALIQQLIEEDLIRPKAPAADLSQAVIVDLVAGALTPPFQTPKLEKFTDMEAMLLLDPVHDVDEGGWPHLPVNDARMDA
jgi:hypothetical protein